MRASCFECHTFFHGDKARNMYVCEDDRLRCQECYQRIWRPKQIVKAAQELAAQCMDTKMEDFAAAVEYHMESRPEGEKRWREGCNND